MADNHKGSGAGRLEVKTFAGTDCRLVNFTANTTNVFRVHDIQFPCSTFRAVEKHKTMFV